MTIYLAENIKRLRKERELTQETLAEFLGVTFQSVSNWERGESFPDITMLPEIAGFFRVSVDELLGVNKAEDEKEITEKLKEYDNLTDHKLMLEIVNELKKKHPNDFRVLIRQLQCLVHFSEDKDAVYNEVHAIYNNIQLNCTNDRIRIKAKRAIIEFYRGLVDRNSGAVTFNDCKKIINELPDMRDSREMFCFFGDKNEDGYDNGIRNTIEEQLLLLNTVYSHFFFYEERFSDEWVLEAFRKELDFLNFIYDDGNYGKMWSTVIYNYGHLGVRYYKLGNKDNALESFGKMCSLAVKFDNMDRITLMHSVMFEGKEFDKHRLGSTYVARKRVKELLTEKYPLSDEFRKSDEFTKLIIALDC